MAAAAVAAVEAVTPAAARHLPEAAAVVIGAVAAAAAAEVAIRPRPIRPLPIRPQHSLATGQRTVPPDLRHMGHNAISWSI